MNSFTQKKLRLTFILADSNAVFPGTNSNTLVIEGHRASVKIQQCARVATQVDVTVNGMRFSDMAALTVCWANPPVVLDNICIIEADSGNGFVQVFKGTIIEAQTNFKGAPDVSFDLLAMTGYYQKINPVEPRSFQQDADIDTIVGGIVADMGGDWSYVNGGAFGTLRKGAYFSGTLWDQLADACAATNTDFYIFGDTVLITEGNKARDDVEQPSVTLTQDSGLVGYPSFERSGLLVTALFDAAFACATPIDITSIVPNASGRWYPYAMLHILEANKPRGQWLTQMQCLRVLT